jgi:hypothetical protein
MPASIAEQGAAVNNKIILWVTTLTDRKTAYNNIKPLARRAGQFHAKIGPARKFLANLGYDRPN